MHQYLMLFSADSTIRYLFSLSIKATTEIDLNYRRCRINIALISNKLRLVIFQLNEYYVNTQL